MPEKANGTLRQIFAYQWWAVVFTVLLLLGVRELVRLGDGFAGELWGISSETWLWISVWVAVAHQVYVWFCWRLELYAGLLTRWFGDRAFALYRSGFAPFLVARFLIILLLAYANRDPATTHPTALKVVAVILAIPALYTLFSIRKYFTFDRAFGIDHFDAAYRNKPLVHRGIFQYTRNGMYTFGLMLLWLPGLWWASVAALVAALFQHVFIWVHYYTTELPDMRHIYGSQEDRTR